ncbi:MAG: bifunctional adenosylcobinamide kinase/adenosylcobinamide-phosphate guanylyltransferase [Rhodobacteraceae bacterium]|nr:bifunctional adenosylcobinamide kinase/adenosylcobinamide-phosphate guanylyltransferase [Paracoccaceae bacterium]
MHFLPTFSFVIGGASSGKSRWAENLVASNCSRPIYVATAEAVDEEMTNRIELHRRRRGSCWRTVECPVDLHLEVARHSAESIVLVECLPTWTANLLHYGVKVPDQYELLVAAIENSRCQLVVVSSEVGCGVIPESALAREFAQLLGEFNQQLAAMAGLVVLITAGIPLVLKGEV